MLYNDLALHHNLLLLHWPDETQEGQNWSHFIVFVDYYAVFYNVRIANVCFAVNCAASSDGAFLYRAYPPWAFLLYHCVMARMFTRNG